MITSKFLDLDGIWQPDGKDPTDGHLLVVLHGRGDSAEGFAGFKSQLNIPGLSVLLLNAPDPYGSGFSWYDLPPHQSPGIIRSRRLLERVFSKIFAEGFRSQKCFLFGFSQGCLMTLEFGGRLPEPLAGAIGISGYCFDPSQLLAEASVSALGGHWLITHGTQDEVLPVERTRKQMMDLVDGGFPIEYLEYPKAHTIDLKYEFPALKRWIEERMNTSV